MKRTAIWLAGAGAGLALVGALVGPVSPAAASYTHAPAAQAATDDQDTNANEQAVELLVESGISSDSLPTDTIEWLATKISEGTMIGSVTSSQYDNQGPAPGAMGPLAYEVAPCYLTVVTEYSFASPRWVQNDSLTGCTVGIATSTRHDMELIKLDTFWGTTSLVASGTATSPFAGGFSSSVTYGCPNSNNSGFQGDTAGEIYYGSKYYYAEATSGGWDYYNCG